MRLVHSARFDPNMSSNEAAAEWFALLRSGDASDEDRQAIDAWRAASPDNEEAWTKIATIVALGNTQADAPAFQALREAALARPAQRRAWYPAALAASLVLVLIGAGRYAGGIISNLNSGTQRPAQVAQETREIRTGIGQRQRVGLGDGSSITVNTASTVEVAYSADTRKIDLKNGEAFFHVAKDSHRPFVVDASDVTVTAVGTQFAVRKMAGEVDVVLAEGRVRVERGAGAEAQSVVLEPGNRLRVTATGFQVSRVDALKSTSWTSGRLLFDQTPLREAVDELNRYSTRKIVLADPQLGSIPVSGEIVTSRPDDLVSTLSATGMVRATQSPDGTVLLQAPR